MSEVERQYKSSDGFIYITYTEQDTYGWNKYPTWKKSFLH